MTELSGFGPRVIGTERFEEEQELIRSGAHIYGNRVVGDAAERAKRLREEIAGTATTPGAEQPNEGPPSFLAGLDKHTTEKLAKINSIGALEQLEQAEIEGDGRPAVLDAILDRKRQVQEEGALTVAALEDALNQAPEFLDEAIRREFNRPLPRKGAIRLFIGVENQRQGGPRVEVLERLETSLAGG